jgi:hypothetical protein
MKKIIDHCAAVTREMVIKYKEQIEKLAILLLEKETIDVLDVINTIGDRPFEYEGSIKEYINEVALRKKEKAEEKKDIQDDGDKKSEIFSPEHNDDNNKGGKNGGGDLEGTEKKFPDNYPGKKEGKDTQGEREKKDIKEAETILKSENK